MAHFAELDENNIVLRVLVVGNDIPTSSGPLGENDMHVDGETWCNNTLGGTWKQTSYNSSFRKAYCGPGHIYDVAKDKFLSPQPYISWALDANDDWQSPVTFPTVKNYGEPLKPYEIEWDEPNQKWTARDKEEPQNSFNWDVSALAWVSA
jgi:hypothetical protein